jgi:hypothetical protein
LSGEPFVGSPQKKSGSSKYKKKFVESSKTQWESQENSKEKTQMEGKQRQQRPQRGRGGGSYFGGFPTMDEYTKWGNTLSLIDTEHQRHYKRWQESCMKTGAGQIRPDQPITPEVEESNDRTLSKTLELEMETLKQKIDEDKQKEVELKANLETVRAQILAGTNKMKSLDAQLRGLNAKLSKAPGRLSSAPSAELQVNEAYCAFLSRLLDAEQQYLKTVPETHSVSAVTINPFARIPPQQ